MAKQIPDEDLREVLEYCEGATEGPYTTGPTTLAGDVWVYAKGSPLLEATHFLAGIWPFKMFRLRSDSYPRFRMNEWEPKGWGEDPSRDKFWVQKQNDAEFFSRSRTDLPRIAKALQAIYAEHDTAKARIEELEKGLHGMSCALIVAQGNATTCKQADSIRKARARIHALIDKKEEDDE